MRGDRSADQEYGLPSPPILNRSTKRESERIACGLIFTQATGPTRSIAGLISRKNAAAARDQQKRGAIPLTEQFGHAVESEPFADGAQIEFELAAHAEN